METMLLSNPEAFFAAVHADLFGGAIEQTQADGINSILGAWPEGRDPRFVAYAKTFSIPHSPTPRRSRAQTVTLALPLKELPRKAPLSPISSGRPMVRIVPVLLMPGAGHDDQEMRVRSAHLSCGKPRSLRRLELTNFVAFVNDGVKVDLIRGI